MTARLTAEQKQERMRARGRLHFAVRSGKLPHPSTLACTDCGGAADRYHHHAGYEPEHALDVVAMCSQCHGHAHTLPHNRPEAVQYKPVGKPGAIRELLNYRGHWHRHFLARTGIKASTFYAVEAGKRFGDRDYYERAALYLQMPIEFVTPKEAAWWEVA